VQEVAVVERLQAEILKVQVAFRLERCAEPLRDRSAEFRVDQFGVDADLMKPGK
jgi:hypothetical protein